MNNFIIPTTDLMYINEVARSMKQRNVMWYNNFLIGIDNLNVFVCTRLDAEKAISLPSKGLILNQRDLSKFCKSIITESSFMIDIDKYYSNELIVTVSETLSISIDERQFRAVIDKLNTYIKISSYPIMQQTKDISTEAIALYSMSKTAGVYKYIYDNEHLMLIPGGLIPLNKSDKLLCSIMDSECNSFYAKFIAKKKIANIEILMAFRKV